MLTLELRQTRAISERAALPLFVAAIFASAFLLFSIEPMFAKMVTPTLGGSPSVWSVATVFFQALMLGGYLYAHILANKVPPLVAVVVHGLVLTAACASLPIAMHIAGAPPSDANPAFWLIGVFGSSVGLVFFALAAQGPLLQAWFSRTAHSRASDPYFLYGASNIGSFAALIAYPLIAEPVLGLRTQSHAWTLGFAAMVVLIAACAAISGPFRSRQASAETTPRVGDASRPSLARKGAWIGLAFIPSGLLVSVTTHISTDIGAAPLLWVLPLGIYLLTFVLAFRDGDNRFEKLLPCLQAWGAAYVLMNIGVGGGSGFFGLLCHLALFFVNGLVCHRALYKLRPDARDLTVFYAIVSFGGVLGGLFAGLLAPVIFSTVAEYPLLVAGALLCRPGALNLLYKSSPREFLPKAAIAIALFAVVLAARPFANSMIVQYAMCGGLGLMILLDWRRPQHTVFAGALLAIYLTCLHGFISPIENFRSFFGVSRIEMARNGAFRLLKHGTTLHGAMRILNDDGSLYKGPPVPTTYYWRNGPMGQAIQSVRAKADGLRNIAVVGLGVGALACHVAPGEAIHFFEIDPTVVKIARDPNRFRFLSECAPDAPITIGDARLTLDADKGRYEIIVVDAFSSDAVPVHLMTREALTLYLSRLSPHGVIALHISNNAMEFSGIIARAAADLGLQVYVKRNLAIRPDDPDMRMASVVALLARDPSDLGPLMQGDMDWLRQSPDMATRPWTDDYSTILTALAAKQFGNR